MLDTTFENLKELEWLIQQAIEWFVIIKEQTHWLKNDEIIWDKPILKKEKRFFIFTVEDLKLNLHKRSGLEKIKVLKFEKCLKNFENKTSVMTKIAPYVQIQYKMSESNFPALICFTRNAFKNGLKENHLALYVEKIPKLENQ